MTATGFTEAAPSTVALDDGDYPKGVRAILAVTVLCLVCSVLTMDVSLVSLLIESVKHDLQLTDEQLGILQGPASSLPYAICAIPAGLLVDRFNRVRLVFAAVALWSAAILSMAFSTSFLVFLVAKVVIGIVMAILLTGPFSLLADVVPQSRRALASSILVIGQSIGYALGFLVGGVVFDALTRHPDELPSWVGDLSPWRISYIIFVLPCILVLPLLGWMREPSRKERKEQRLELAASVRELYAYRRLLLPLFIAYAFQVITDSTMRVWLSPALIRLYHLTPGEFGGWIGGTILVAGMVGSGMGGWLAERARQRSNRLTAAVVAAVIVAASSCLALMPSVPLLFVLFAIGTVAVGVITTLTTVAGIVYVPNELRGFASGIVILVAVGPGLAIGPTLVPAVTDALGGPLEIGKAMALVGVPSGLLAAFFFAFLRTDSRERAGS